MVLGHGNHCVVVIIVIIITMIILNGFAPLMWLEDSLAVLINVNSINASNQNWNLFYEMQLFQHIFIIRNISLLVVHASEKTQIYFEVKWVRLWYKIRI